MNKREFLNCLEMELRSLPEAERNQMRMYYSEMISDKMEEGKTEEEAVAELKRPQYIAEEILANSEFQKENAEYQGAVYRENQQGTLRNQEPRVREPFTMHRLWMTILAIACIPCWIWGVSMMISVAGIVVTAFFIWKESEAAFVVCIGAALICMAIGILVLLLARYCNIGFRAGLRWLKRKAS